LLLLGGIQPFRNDLAKKDQIEPERESRMQEELDLLASAVATSPI
jgi:hypothetical protein